MKQLKNKERRNEKEKIRSQAVDSYSVSFAQRKPFDAPSPPPQNLLTPPLRPHYCRATTFAVFFSVLTLRQNSKTSPKRFKTTPKFVTFKLLIYSNVPKYILVALQVSTCWDLIPRGGTPYNGLYGEAPPEMVTFLRLQVRDMKG